jgi:GT2 family glycosyltransferase
MYAEDIDLAYRIKQAGWKIVYNPLTKIIHLKGASGIAAPDKQRRIRTVNSFFSTMKLFYHKHYQKKYFLPLCWLVFLGIDLVKLWKISKIKFF